MTDLTLNVEDLPWLASARQQIRLAWKQQRLPHGLLIHGAAGLGKRALARWIAASVLCDTASQQLGACGFCKSCTLVAGGTHPDFVVIQPEEGKQQISVEQIRDLCATLAMTSYRDGYKVAIVEPASQMTLAAANSLLKTLEEPAKRTILILISQRMSGLLPTLRSRCQQIAIKRPAEEVAFDWFSNVQKNAVSPELLRLAHGAPLKALEYATNDVDALLSDLDGGIRALNDGRSDVTQIAKRWVDETLPVRLLCLDYWLENHLRVCLLGSADRFTSAPLPSEGLGLNISRLFHCLDRVRELRAQLNRISLQKELAIETLLIDIKGAFRASA